MAREIYFGEIEGKDHPGGSARHRYTTDLVGRAIHWEMPAFTGKPPIKHIYLSPKYYGIFMTRDDTCFMSADPAEYIRIRDDLYLVTVVEERRSGIQLSFLINRICSKTSWGTSVLVWEMRRERIRRKLPAR